MQWQATELEAFIRATLVHAEEPMGGLEQDKLEDSSSWDRPAGGVFSASSKSSEYCVSVSQGLLWPCPITAVCILSHLVYFKFLKGRRKYALLAFVIFFCIVGTGLSYKRVTGCGPSENINN